jgi:hypothetical protein
MKCMLLIHQGITPLPGSPAWEALPGDEKGKVYANYQAINETPRLTPGVQMASPGPALALVDDEAERRLHERWLHELGAT